jgi:nuclear pore complex protein Nup98-Nup96
VILSWAWDQSQIYSFLNRSATPEAASKASPAASRRVTFDSDVDTRTNGDAGANTPVKRSGGSSANLVEESTKETRRPASSRVRKDGDYYSEPSLEALQRLPASQLQSVSDLVVGRQGFGEVRFSEPVDLTTLNSVEDLLGGVVVIGDRQVTVYPEAELKPAAGRGLNVKATITIEKCFPRSKGTKEPVTDATAPAYIKHVKRLKNMDGTAFISFEDGKWTFSVDGF